MNGVGFLDVLMYELLMSTVSMPKFVERIRGLRSGVQNELNFIDSRLDSNVIVELNRQLVLNLYVCVHC